MRVAKLVNAVMKNDLNKLASDLKKTLITTHNFPKANFVYRNVVDLLLKSELYHRCIDQLVEFVREVKATSILSPELSGCLFAAPVSYRLGCRFVLARKPGKLPGKVYSIDYANEYFKQTIQIHQSALTPQDRVFIMDDVISTGGTLFALRDLAQKAGAKVVGAGFLFETVLSSNRQWEMNFPVYSILKYTE